MESAFNNFLEQHTDLSSWWFVVQPGCENDNFHLAAYMGMTSRTYRAFAGSIGWMSHKANHEIFSPHQFITWVESNPMQKQGIEWNKTASKMWIRI